MRVLFLTQLPPLPLDAGPKTRSYYVLRHLVEAGHDVSLVCFRRSGDNPGDLSELRQVCRKVETVLLTRSRVKDLWCGLRSLFSSTPFLVQRDDLAAMWRTLESLLAGQTFDAIHADQLWMAPYGLKFASIPLKVLDQHNAVFLATQRMAEQVRNPFVRSLIRREAAKLETFEQSVCRTFDRVVWVSEADRNAVANGHATPGRHRVIPIAVDPRAQQPVVRPRPFRVTFLGGMHWPPNADGISWFADAVWPEVAKAVPGAVLTVIGKKPPQRVLDLAKSGNVEVPGFVSDPGQYLAETAAFIVPIRSGAGMRVKILDAWCWELPVISTTVGAEGTEARNGHNLLLADEAGEFARSVIRVLQDGGVSGAIARNGRVTAEEVYDWKKVYAAWDQIYH